MAVSLTFDIQNATIDWQIYWRLVMENPESFLSDEHRKTIREQLPQEILDMEISPAEKERVITMAVKAWEEVKTPSTIWRKHIYASQPVAREEKPLAEYEKMLLGVADEFIAETDKLTEIKQREADAAKTVMEAFATRHDAVKEAYTGIAKTFRVKFSQAFQNAMVKALIKENYPHLNQGGTSQRKRRRVKSIIAANRARLKMKIIKKEGNK